MSPGKSKLNYRPESYWDPADPVIAITGNVTGALRREAIRRTLEDDLPLDAMIDDEALQDVLSEERRAAQGAIHPWLMGGEYLPPYLPGEVEIARITLGSVMMDVIAIRARRQRGRILYRVVDEYPEDGLIRSYRPKSSPRPLTLGELVGLIDSMRSDECARGQTYLEWLRDTGCEDIESAADFVEVSSPFYPELKALFDARAADWLAERRRKLAEEEEEGELENDA